MRTLITCIMLFASTASAQEMITTEGAATFELEINPSPPEFGRPAKIVLEVKNANDEPLNYRLQAMLSMAMFAGGSNGARLISTEPGNMATDIEWPQRSVAANKTQTMELNVILRDDKEAAMLADFELANMSDGNRQRANFRIDPVWPESTSTATWTGLFMLFTLTIAVGVFACYPLSRVMYLRTGGGARGSIGAIAILVIPILAVLVFVLSLIAEYRVFTSFRESTCTVTDRVVETVTAADAPMEPNMSWTEGRRRVLHYAAFVAVILELPDGPRNVVWNTGENGSAASGPADWVEEVTEPYGPGKVFPCWYNAENPNSLALKRSISWPIYLIMTLILVLPRIIAKWIGSGAGKEQSLT